MSESDHLFNQVDSLGRRRQLRKQPTEPEQRFWRAVRNQQLGVKFRRQQGIGPYIVDFYCAERALVIELDGDSHFSDQGIAHDRVRTDFLHFRGLKILRFTNNQITQEIDAALAAVMQSLGP